MTLDRPDASPSWSVDPEPRSRTLEAALLLVDHLGGAIPTLLLDLADHAEGDASSSESEGWVEELRAADLVVVAQAPDRVRDTGLLASFMDRVPRLGMHDQVAVPLTLGGGASSLALRGVAASAAARAGRGRPGPRPAPRGRDHTDPAPYRAWAAAGASLRTALHTVLLARTTTSGVPA